MERLTSTEEYKTLIKTIKTRFGKVDTNCILMSGSMEPYIREERLYVRHYPNGIVLYVDEGEYYEAYYFWNPAAPLGDLRADKSISVVEANNAGKRDEYIARMEKKLQEAGFVFFKVTTQLELSVPAVWEREEQAFLRQKDELSAGGFQLLSPVPSELAAPVVELWERELDAMDIPVDHKTFLDRPEDRTACVVQNGQLAAAYWWRLGRTSAEGRHIVTNPGFTRRGLASLLLRFCIGTMAQDRFSRLITYVSDDNTSSLKLHEKVGFRANGKTNKQFILK